MINIYLFQCKFVVNCSLYEYTVQIYSLNERKLLTNRLRLAIWVAISSSGLCKVLIKHAKHFMVMKCSH